MADSPALDIRFAPGPGAGSLQDQLYAELDAFEPVAIQEHDAGDGWLVYFRLPAHRTAALDQLRFALGTNVIDVAPVDVPDEDWARRSQASLAAIRVGRLVVAPPWDVPTPDPATTVIVIDPSMGFGTGHHATTRLCLALLQDLDVAGRRVIDVGTGSGVLAIASRLLGAAEVAAVDHDPDALMNARENIARNAGAAGVQVLERDLGALTMDAADVVTANLTGAVLQKHARALERLIAPGGALIVSGFSPPELPDVSSALDMRVERSRDETDWAAALLRR